MQMKIFLTNLGKYNEGELVGQWFTLPINITESLKEIDVVSGTQYEEYFITDYENNLNLKIHEYTSLDKLNKIAEYAQDKDIEEIYNDIVYYYDNDDVIYDIELLDDVLYGKSPSDVANMIHFGSYNPSHDYFRLDGYENIETLSCWDVEAIKKDIISDNIEQFVEENY